MKRKKDIIHILAQERKEPSERSTEGIIQRNQDLLREVFAGKIPRRKQRFKIEQALADWQFKGGFEDEQKHVRLRRIALLLKLEDLRQHLSKPDISDDNRFFKVCELGVCRSELRDVEQRIETLDEHRALDIARRLWEEGDQRIHDEMAEYLKEVSPELSHDNLQKKLMPLVEKYDRMSNPRLPRKRMRGANALS